MKKLFIFIFSILSLSFINSSNNLKHSEDISPYVEFLKEQNTSAKDYVLELFNTKDLVLLCERLHPELTQYEMILGLVKDPRYMDKIGNIFIETCGRDQEANIHSLLNNKLSETQAEELILHICRNNSIHPVWNNYNFYFFLKELYLTNKNLVPDKRIQVYPADIAVKWEELDKELYDKDVKSQFPNRDKLMAEYIIETFDSIINSSAERKKTLVVMNFRHAFANKFRYPNDVKPNNVGRFLMDHYGDEMANVFINSINITDARSDNDMDFEAHQKGKWDAAFKVIGKDDLGFDFEDNIFGNDSFDYWQFTPHNYVYSDVFDGMIYYRSIDSQKIVYGIPNLVDDEFFDEIKRRDKIAGINRADSIIWEMNTKVDRIELFLTDSIKSQINTWIE